MVYLILFILAIGRSTNLISPDSNILIVRKGSRPIRVQVLDALEMFFEEPIKSSSERPLRDEPIPLQRINTGVSTIVGADNGNRDGGFVLVVDDSVLLEVKLLFFFRCCDKIENVKILGLFGRRDERQFDSACCSM